MSPRHGRIKGEHEKRGKKRKKKDDSILERKNTKIGLQIPGGGGENFRVNFGVERPGSQP